MKDTRTKKNDIFLAFEYKIDKIHLSLFGFPL